MKTPLNNNSLFTVGIEEEYMICDPINGELVNKAESIIKSISLNDNNKKSLINRFSYELLLSEIESNTKVCNTVDEAINELIFLRNILKDIGHKENFKIGISGTHPTAKSTDQEFVENKSYTWVKDQLQYYASKNITFSTHVHIGIKNPDDAIKITNSSRRWIAPLLALSANSPFFEGELTGMQSSRTFQFGIFPRTNIPYYIPSLDNYIKLIKKLSLNKSILKPRHIWWKIRPHLEYGTVEFRMCDVQRSLSNTFVLAAIIQALVHTIYTNRDYNDSNYDQNILEDGLWNVAKNGINSSIIDPFNNNIIDTKDMIFNMIKYIEKSLNYFNNYNKVIERVDSILKNGTESNQQIKIFNKDGMSELKKYLINNVEY